MLVDKNPLAQPSTSTKAVIEATSSSYSSKITPMGPFHFPHDHHRTLQQQQTPSTPITPTPPTAAYQTYFDQPASNVFMDQYMHHNSRDKAPDSFLLFSAKRRYESPNISSQQLIDEWRDMSQEQKADFQNQSQCIQFTLDIDKERQLREQQQFYFSHDTRAAPAAAIPKMIVPSMPSLQPQLSRSQQPSMIIPNSSEEEDQQPRQHPSSQSYTPPHPSHYLIQQYQRSSVPTSFTTTTTTPTYSSHTYPQRTSFIHPVTSLYPPINTTTTTTTAFRHPQSEQSASLATTTASNTHITFPHSATSAPASASSSTHPLNTSSMLSSHSLPSNLSKTLPYTDMPNSLFTSSSPSTASTTTTATPTTAPITNTAGKAAAEPTFIEKVKRPPNAYLLFNRDMRKHLQQEQPMVYQGLCTGDISKIIAQKWKALPAEERHYYLQEEAKLKEKHRDTYTHFMYARRSKTEMIQKTEPSSSSSLSLIVKTEEADHEDKEKEAEEEEENDDVEETETKVSSHASCSNNAASSSMQSSSAPPSMKVTTTIPTTSTTAIKPATTKNSTTINTTPSQTNTTPRQRKRKSISTTDDGHTSTPTGRDPRGRKKKKADDHTLPKHPMSGYLHFAKKMRPIMKQRNPEAKLVEISRSIGEQWRAMSAEEMQPWIDIANEDKARYAREMKERSQLLQQQQQQQQLIQQQRPYPTTSNITTTISNQQAQTLPMLQYEEDQHNRRYSMATTATISSSHSSSSSSSNSDSISSNSISSSNNHRFQGSKSDDNEELPSMLEVQMVAHMVNSATKHY